MASSTGVSPLTPFFLWWRTTVVRDREIVDAVVEPAHQGPSAELERALTEWPGPHYWARGDGEGRLVLVRALQPAPRERWPLHALLFFATFFTVWMGGALLAGSTLPLAFPFNIDFSIAPQLLVELLRELVTLREGLGFALGLMAILLAHEYGHYLVARRYGIDASPPYFIPAPPVVNFIGTFGAFIKLRSPVVDRQQLVDVGAAGPWAGFVVAVVVLVAGLMRSEVVAQVGASEQFITLAHYRLYLGHSPIMYVARLLVLGDGTVMLHPLAFAGWIGLLVTMLNLIPLGRLDGGHILYALIGRRQATVSGFVWLALVGLGFLAAARGSFWAGLVWWVWAAVILMLGRGQVMHPQVLDRHRPLPSNRRPLGWATLLLFIGTFTPVPVYYG